MILERLVVGPLQCNCLIVGCERTREALVIDPGDEVGRVLQALDRLGLRVKAILHTHAHFDHVGATGPLREATGAPVYLHRDDQPLYENLALQAELFGLKAPEAAPVDHWLGGEEAVEAGSNTARVLHTPGHSPGSVCFLLPGSDESVLCSGDTLFAGGVGRTDLWGGSYEQLMSSIRTKLLTLPDGTEVYPGHGPSTTIGQEKRFNPFLQSFF